jgi:hypothetical protein
VSVVWRYAVREGLIRTDIADEYVKWITRRLTPGLVGCAVMIMIGLFLPLAAVLGYLIIAVYNLIPFRGVRRSRAATEQSGDNFAPVSGVCGHGFTAVE